MARKWRANRGSREISGVTPPEWGQNLVILGTMGGGLGKFRMVFTTAGSVNVGSGGPKFFLKF
jgi:hypothetical protein